MKLLVAHSSEKHAYKLKQFLENSGFDQFYFADNGFEALDYIVRYNINICVLDQYLTGLNSEDIINAVRFKGINTKFIILTSKERLNMPEYRNILGRLNLNDKDVILQIKAILKKEIKALGLKHIKNI